MRKWEILLRRYYFGGDVYANPIFTRQGDLRRTEGLLLDGWEQRDGKLLVPGTPGTGFDLEPELIERGVRADDGYRVEVRA